MFMKKGLPADRQYAISPEVHCIKRLPPKARRGKLLQRQMGSGTLLFLLADKSGCTVPALVLPLAATAASSRAIAAGVASTAATARRCPGSDEDAAARRLLAPVLATGTA